jgi:ABC-type amino acid transport substrate-binding protein
MKHLAIKISILLFLTFTVTGYCQNNNDSLTIRLGVKEIVPNLDIENQIKNGTYNNIDAFEYEMAKLLVDQIENQHNFKLVQIKVEQSQKFKKLKEGVDFDALLYTFSETEDRKIKHKLHFSDPYFLNDGIGIIVNDENIDVKSLGKSLIRIGAVNNTRPIDHLILIKENYKNNDSRDEATIVIDSVSSHKELIEKLRTKQIDAAAGDISRLLYETADGDFTFGGFLPTNQSQIKDSYCIGITPEKAYLKATFNDLLKTNETQVINLQKKWIGTISKNFYSKYDNKAQDKYTKNIVYVLIANLLAFLFALAFGYRYMKRKQNEIKKQNETILNLEKGHLEEQKLKDFNRFRTDIDKITATLRLKTKNKLTSDLVAQAGIEMFETAQKSITYVGSGGFLSDTEHGDKWLSALHNCLTKDREDKFEFNRVVDLPEMDNNKFKFSDNPYFNPPNNDYVKKYLKWLLLQYANLKTYTNLKIINSRGAALWSYGIVMIIKDQREVLIFTSTKNSRFGMHIPSPELGESIHTLIKEIIDIGSAINRENIENTFFKNQEGGYKIHGLNDVLIEINKLHQNDKIPDIIMGKINALCGNLKHN